MRDLLPSEASARELDARDPLRALRREFLIPKRGGSETIYLCGHSLGLQPRSARRLVDEHLEEWAKRGVDGHFKGRAPWFPYHERFRKPLARLVGAKPREAVAMNSLSVNMHLLLASFYRPTKARFKIITDAPVFPSDLYALKSQLRWHGFDPKAALVLLQPRPGETALRPDDMESVIDREGPRAAVLWLNGVNFLTGQAYPIPRLAAAARRRGIRVGLDLAHAAGNVPLSLHDWNVDFAVWCSYKYLNAGPGAVGGAFVHERHARDARLPRLAGWWGHDPRTRFRMQLEPRFSPQPGAEGWQLSNPPILSLAPLEASLALFDRAGMPALRGKSERLSAYWWRLLGGLGSRIEMITPADPAQRGCQVSLRVRRNGRAVHRKLEEAGIVCDFRQPDVIRAAAVPLYNSFHDAWVFARTLLRHA
ncbi:MAG: kynureninase [Elusimicrobia bacterium]|nr:kynureninase [Elusimicrobiota bacterium]